MKTNDDLTSSNDGSGNGVDGQKARGEEVTSRRSFLKRVIKKTATVAGVVFVGMAFPNVASAASCGWGETFNCPSNNVCEVSNVCNTTNTCPSGNTCTANNGCSTGTSTNVCGDSTGTDSNTCQETNFSGNYNECGGSTGDTNNCQGSSGYGSNMCFRNYCNYNNNCSVNNVCTGTNVCTRTNTCPSPADNSGPNTPC